MNEDKQWNEQQDPGMNIPTPPVDYGHLVKFFFILFAMIVVAVVVFVASVNMRDTSAEQEQQEAYEKYLAAERRYVEAMTADTYGGATPQETLDLFVAALEDGDIELASKYFALDHETLKRTDKYEALVQAEQEGRISHIIDSLQNLEPDEDSILNDRDYVLIALNDQGLVKTLVNFQFNPYSETWKIESM